MIKKLNHTNQAIATKMRIVFQESYAIEAKLLNAINFPPCGDTTGTQQQRKIGNVG